MIQFIEAIMLFFFMMCGITLLLTANLLFTTNKKVRKDFLTILLAGEVFMGLLMFFWTINTSVFSTKGQSEIIFIETLLVMAVLMWITAFSLTLKLLIETKINKSNLGLYAGIFLLIILCSIITPIWFYNSI